MKIQDTQTILNINTIKKSHDRLNFVINNIN